MKTWFVLLAAVAGSASAQTAPAARPPTSQYCNPCPQPCPNVDGPAACGAVAAAPAPAKPADPCAPGQSHTPEQCPALDDDGDGIANADDRCPLQKGIPQEKGCPPKDSDGDGIFDHEDACPDVKGVAEEKGCPPKDSDGDGIIDAQDRCPKEPGVPAEQGCPPARAKISAETGKIDIKEKVFFDTGKSTIQPRSFGLLDDVAALLVANPKVGPVTVEGHTDDRGPAELNRTLSQARAEAVKAYLVGKGVDASRLEAKGFGPDRPAQPNTTKAGREANRRVEFVITGLKAQ
ncbi:MAG TPA: OmpA family protein [Anaeromyxobacteraceae bacterium]|nr:OmpA family protein [Anaeromyxobacteraceae bacterium]